MLTAPILPIHSVTIRKYAFQQSVQIRIRRHFKGHLSLKWRTCQSPVCEGAKNMAQKDYLDFISFPLPNSDYNVVTFTMDWQAIYTHSCYVFKAEDTGRRGRRSPLLSLLNPRGLQGPNTSSQTCSNLHWVSFYNTSRSFNPWVNTKGASGQTV